MVKLTGGDERFRYGPTEVHIDTTALTQAYEGKEKDDAIARLKIWKKRKR